jgi:uncharacterized protein
MTYPPGTPCWVDLGTPDAGPSLRFYRDLLGWEAVASGPGYWRLRHDGANVAGVSDDAVGAPSAWRTYVSVEDADAIEQRVAAGGGKVLLAPTDVPGAGRMAVFADPEGLTFCAWQAREHAGSEKVNEPVSLTWSELHTSDLAGAQAFYASVFGWETQEQEMGGVRYVTLHVGGRPVAGAVEAGHPGWHVYFAVADTDAIVAQARELGATVDTEPTDIPGVGRYADFTDPQGARFGVIRG